MSAKGYSLNALDAYFLRFIGRPQSGYIEIPPHFIESYLTPQGCESMPNSAHTDSPHKGNLLNLSTDLIKQDLVKEEADCTPQIFEITLTKAHFLQALATSKAAMKSVTLIPGETNYFFLQEIARVFELDKDKLEQYYNQYAPYSDGVILANTYSLPYHAKEEAIISMLISQSLEKHKALAQELLGRYNEQEWFQIVAKASIIQKEAANVAEMPIVSSVIDNRIAKNMPLQMDGSLNYGKYSHTRITPDRIRNDLSEFNTYKHVGIPKTPSGSVSIDAIKAAINPAKTDYLYFMRNKNGTHDFTSTYKEHLQNIKKVQQKR